MTQTVDARGGVTRYLWNPTTPFLLDSVDDAAAKSGAHYTYDAANGYGLQQTRVKGQQVEYRSYSAGRLASVSTAGTPPTSYDYTGRPASDPRPANVRDPRGHVTTYTYEAGGLQNAQSATDAAGTATVVHDVFGRDSVTTDPLGQRTVVTYDVMNRRTRATDANGRATTTAYDALYARTVTDAVGQVYRDSVNALGLPAFSYDPAGGAAATAYDAAGRVASVTNRRGQTVSFGYDATLGFLNSRTTPDGSNATYGTDALGRVRWARNGESVDSAFTDSLGRDTLAVHRLPALAGYRYMVQSTYDSLGRRTRAWYGRNSGGAATTADLGNSNQTWYTYGSAGELQSINGAQLAYNNEFAPTSIRYPSAYFSVTRGYTDQHTLASQHFSSTAENVLAAHFSYDSLNRITARYSPDMTQRMRYAYDRAGQLTSNWVGTVLNISQQCVPTYGPGAVAGDSAVAWSCPGVYDSTNTVAYAYDAVGNPVRSDVYILPGTGNRMAWANGQNLGYDADGNMWGRLVNGAVAQRLSWNVLGQLTGVNNVPVAGSGWTLTDSLTFGYDGWGRRVRKTNVTTGVTTSYLWDGDDLAATLQGGTVARYTYYPGAVDRPHSVTRGPAGQAGTTSYYVQDAAPGNVLGLITAGGQVAATYQYDPWGRVTAASEAGLGGWSNPLRFGAREYDAETGLAYHRARYYDPQLQRFVSRDPSGLGGGVNLYAYAGNDPVNYSDPSGLDCVSLTFTVPDGAECDINGCAVHGREQTVRICGGGGGGSSGGFGGPGGGGGGGSSAFPAQQPVNHAPLAYTPLPSCPAALSTGDVQEALQAAMQHSTSATPGPTGYPEFGGVHVQVLNHGQTYGHYGASGNTVSMPPSAPAGAMWWFHDHPNTGTWGSFPYAQGPSVADAAVSNRLGVPGYIISHDSLFVVQSNGSAVGCHR